MKKLIIITLSILSLTIMAQVPQGVGYQGVATNAIGVELVNQAISIRASVLSGSATGTIEWEETHATSTDTFGLFTLTIGQGTSTGNGTQTNFADISWGTNTHYLKIEMDVTGGSTYSNMGTNQMMSVPYALYAENANINYDSITTLLSNDSTFISSIGGGGNMVFGNIDTINLNWYNGTNTGEYQASEDGFLIGYVYLYHAANVRFYCDSFSGNTTLVGYEANGNGTAINYHSFTFPIKKDYFYSFEKLGNSNVHNLFWIPLESGGGSTGNQPNIYLECVDMGIAPVCGSLGLDPSYTLSSPDNYFYNISWENNLNGSNYTIEPHWRKFEIVGLELNPGDKLLFKHQHAYTNPSSVNLMATTTIPPEVVNGKVYFYMHGEMQATNGVYAGSFCVNTTNLALVIPLSNSIKVTSVHGSNQWNALTELSHFEIFYETEGCYKSTGIIFNAN